MLADLAAKSSHREVRVVVLGLVRWTSLGQSASANAVETAIIVIDFIARSGSRVLLWPRQRPLTHKCQHIHGG